MADLRLRRTGKLNSRRAVAIAGFLAGAVFIIPATLTASPGLCVLFTCLAFFGIELTVGVSWAIPLDIAGDRAGSVSSLMNMCGNIGAALFPAAVGTLIDTTGDWNLVLYLFAGILAIDALFWALLNPRRPLFQDDDEPH